MIHVFYGNFALFGQYISTLTLEKYVFVSLDSWNYE